MRSILPRLTGRVAKKPPSPPPPPPYVSEKTYPQVEVYSWTARGESINFGDYLSRVIVERLLAERALERGEEVARRARLFAIGSVLHFATDGDTIWGSGVNGKIAEESYHFQTLDVRAVRGPKTAEFLRRRGIAVPDVFGDPALLLPDLFGDRFQPRPAGGPIFIPNLNDYGTFDCPIPLVSPLRGWNYVVEHILGAELVLSSSLHGIIIAEAFGIPALYVRLSEREALFKYEDYVLGTGRGRLEYATSIAKGLKKGGMSGIRWDSAPLKAAFPYDLWARPAS